MRRATIIESGLFTSQARHLLQFQRLPQTYGKRQQDVERVYRNAVLSEGEMGQHEDEPIGNVETGSESAQDLTGQSDDLTRAFVRLTNLPTCPLDRLSRYEGTLWRQACQILFTLQFLNRRRPWEKLKLR